MPTPKEYKVVALRDCPVENGKLVLDTPEQVAKYWRDHIATEPRFNPEVETLVVVMLNTRRLLKGHTLVSTGTLDTLLVHPREVFRTAIVMAAHAIVMLHNHPSGDPTPSEADIKVTRELIQGGKLLKIEMLDHVIMGKAQDGNPKDYISLRELGYFYN